MRWLLLALWLGSTTCAFAGCPPAGYDHASLDALKAAKFEVRDTASRNALAEGLLDCLGDPDPALRDGIAYEAFGTWMRAGAFDAEELRRLRDGLYARLEGDDRDGDVEHDDVRVVNACGHLHLGGRRGANIFVSSALAGYCIGLREIDVDRWLISTPRERRSELHHAPRRRDAVDAFGWRWRKRLHAGAA